MLLFCMLSFTSAWATTHVIKLGENYTCQSGELVKCENLATCSLKYHYVSKSYQVFLPKGEEFGRYEDYDKALQALQSLLALKNCKKTDIEPKKN